MTLRQEQIHSNYTGHTVVNAEDRRTKEKTQRNYREGSRLPHTQFSPKQDRKETRNVSQDASLRQGQGMERCTVSMELLVNVL